MPASRFWEPFDPVVLIADGDLRLTERHGEDGRLRDDGLLTCYHVQLPAPLEGNPPTLEQIFNAVMSAIDDAESVDTPMPLPYVAGASRHLCLRSVHVTVAAVALWIA